MSSGKSLGSLGYSNLLTVHCAYGYVTVTRKPFLPVWSPGGERRAMDGQIELLDYLESLEETGFNILDYIPTGHDNAIRRDELCKRTGFNDRTVRELIHRARRTMPILNMQDSHGYFIPDMNRTDEKLMLKRYVQQETNRLKSIGWGLKAARHTLKSCGVDWRN